MPTAQVNISHVPLYATAYLRGLTGSLTALAERLHCIVMMVTTAFASELRDEYNLAVIIAAHIGAIWFIHAAVFPDHHRQF